MKNFITINGRKIGEDYKPLVIPEIGINHNGSLSEAKKIVDAACEAGAEIIKHQTHIVEDEMIPLAKNIIPNNAKESIYEKACICLYSLTNYTNEEFYYYKW